jgi:uncharacterized membrane protein YphA (DoxX/SURF4 family)
MMTRLSTPNLANPVGQAFWIARIIFTIAPILFGLDKFFNILVDWPKYLAPWIPSLIHVSPQAFMHGVGVVEIVAGILVGIWPQYFAYAVTLWLWGIIVNLLTIPGYYDVALRDFGLSLGALTLARLARAHQLELRDRVDTEMLAADRDGKAYRGLVHHPN